MSQQTGTSGPPDPSTAAAERHTAIGIALVLTSAVAWSTAGFFARMVPVDIWIVLAWRSAFGALSIAALTLIERRRFAFDWRRAFVPTGITMMILKCIGMAGFVYALQNTTIANGSVIASTIPFMAAALAWCWFRERPGRRDVPCPSEPTLVPTARIDQPDRPQGELLRPHPQVGRLRTHHGLRIRSGLDSAFRIPHSALVRPRLR